VLATSVSRKRRELALLRALGFTPNQVRATVGWHASTIAALALVVGIPVGVLAGRWLWHERTSSLGIEFLPRTPLLATVLLVPLTLLFANAIAWMAAHSAAQTQPAESLRQE
jgi:ABC-type lipoprotein release transport system permease subunit